MNYNKGLKMYCKNSNDYQENEMPKTEKTAMAVLSPENEKVFMYDYN